MWIANQGDCNTIANCLAMKAEFFHSSAIKDYTENLLPKLWYIHTNKKKRPLNTFSHKPAKLFFLRVSLLKSYFCCSWFDSFKKVHFTFKHALICQEIVICNKLSWVRSVFLTFYVSVHTCIFVPNQPRLFWRTPCTLQMR